MDRFGPATAAWFRARSPSRPRCSAQGWAAIAAASTACWSRRPAAARRWRRSCTCLDRLRARAAARTRRARALRLAAQGAGLRHRAQPARAAGRASPARAQPRASAIATAARRGAHRRHHAARARTRLARDPGGDPGHHARVAVPACSARSARETLAHRRDRDRRRDPRARAQQARRPPRALARAARRAVRAAIRSASGCRRPRARSRRWRASSAATAPVTIVDAAPAPSSTSRSSCRCPT